MDCVSKTFSVFFSNLVRFVRIVTSVFSLHWTCLNCAFKQKARLLCFKNQRLHKILSRSKITEMLNILHTLTTKTLLSKILHMCT